MPPSPRRRFVRGVGVVGAVAGSTSTGANFSSSTLSRRPDISTGRLAARRKLFETSQPAQQGNSFGTLIYIRDGYSVEL
jgi:hypothetical protein